MKNKQRILKSLSLLLVLSLLSAAFGTIAVFATGTNAQQPTVTYGDTWDGTTTDTQWDAVAGKENTYSITSGAELAGLAAQVNAGNTYEGYTFLITKNINLNDQAWTPISNTSKKPFNGTLKGALDGAEGTSVTIGNMKIENGVARSALVGTQNGGGIHDITMVDTSISTANLTAGCFIGSNDSGTVSYSNLHVKGFTLNVTATKAYFGAMAGVVKGNSTWENCSVEDFTYSGKAQCGSKASQGSFIGGFVGDIQTADTTNTFTNCSVTGVTYDITTATKMIGGFVGRVNTAASFNTCTAESVTITTADTGTYIGGFVGYPASSSTYTDCGVTTFKLYGKTEQNAVTAIYVGGFSGGAATYPSYTRCSANSIDLKINGNGGTQLVGGFTGMVRKGLDPVATFDTVTSSGTITVTGTPGTQFGGLIGIIRDNATLTDCSSSVNLIFSDGGAQNVGGLVGNVYNDVKEVTISNCDFTGSITTSSGTNVGGLVGINIGMGVTLANCEMGGTVTVTEGTNVGALVGTLTDGTVNGTLDMEGCTVTAETNYNWFGTDTKDCHITLKNGNSSVEFDTLKIRYQTKDDGAADTETFRLIATVDAYISTYEKLGFVLTDSQNQSVTLETTTVWDTIAGGGNTYVPSEAGDGQTSAGYGENSVFFFAVEQEAVSLAATFTVQAFVVQSGVTILGEAFTFCVGDLLPVQ